VTTKTDAFRALHAGDPFIIPNPWDAGSAKVLAALGFKALATTSSGFAFTLGRRDGGVSLDEALANARLIDAATDLPVSVDMEDGYGPSPEDAARAVREAREAGVAGGSVEDWDRSGRIFERAEAVERIAAAAEAAGGEFVLTARAENLLHGVTDLDDTIARLQAYGEAGADVVYAPGLRTAEQVRAVCSSLDKPVNVLGHRGLTFAEIAEAGGQRVSVGGALTWAAATAFVAAARKLSDGDFSALTGSGEIAGWLDPA
jgi:2-methylisocitrate lyase-like PEP mutase family enzyme